MIRVFMLFLLLGATGCGGRNFQRVPSQGMARLGVAVEVFQSLIRKREKNPDKILIAFAKKMGNSPYRWVLVYSEPVRGGKPYFYLRHPQAPEDKVRLTVTKRGQVIPTFRK